MSKEVRYISYLQEYTITSSNRLSIESYIYTLWFNKRSLIYVFFLSLHNLLLKLYNFSNILTYFYQCLFFLLYHTFIYHKISYMDSYLDSMEREVEDGSLRYIQYHTNRSYEMKNEYLLNCEELLEDQRFVFLYNIQGKQVGK